MDGIVSIVVVMVKRMCGVPEHFKVVFIDELQLFQ